MNKMAFVVYAIKEPISTLKNLSWLLYPNWLLQILYGNIKTYSLNLQNKKILYSTKDIYSKKWFFPRYAGKKIHEESVTKLFAKECAGKKEILDVGAHIGFYTCIAGKISKGNVVGFEIDRRSVKIAEKNIKLNNLKNTKVQQKAVSAKEGTLFIEEPETISPALSIAEKGNVKIRCTSIDSLYKSKKKNPDLIKIDVEGAEMEVLKGMKSVLQKGSATIFLEMHPHYWKDFNTNNKEILEYLKKYKYSIYEIGNLRSSSTNLLRIRKERPIKTNCMLYAIKK